MWGARWLCNQLFLFLTRVRMWVAKSTKVWYLVFSGTSAPDNNKPILHFCAKVEVCVTSGDYDNFGCVCFYTLFVKLFLWTWIRFPTRDTLTREEVEQNGVSYHPERSLKPEPRCLIRPNELVENHCCFASITILSRLFFCRLLQLPAIIWVNRGLNHKLQGMWSIT